MNRKHDASVVAGSNWDGLVIGLIQKQGWLPYFWSLWALSSFCFLFIFSYILFIKLMVASLQSTDLYLNEKRNLLMYINGCSLKVLNHSIKYFIFVLFLKFCFLKSFLCLLIFPFPIFVQVIQQNFYLTIIKLWRNKWLLV